MSGSFRLPASGLYPWNGAGHSYVGWVPNVSGHLSFGLICPKGEPHAINHRSVSTGQRNVAVHTRRSAEDFPLPGQLVGSVRRSVTQDYILVGRTCPAKTPFLCSGSVDEIAEEHGALVGLVLVVPRDAGPAAQQRRRQFLKDIDHAIEEALADASATPPVGPTQADGLPESLEHLAIAAQQDIVCHVARFALFRTGELRVWFNEDDFVGRDTLAQPLTGPERLAAQYLPSQMYFFLKDTTHQHYHHDPQTDQLLGLYRVHPLAGAFDDLSWRIDTLRGLAKVVVEYRHSNHPMSNKKALGILAYADAFQSLLAQVRRGDRSEQAMQPLTGVIPYDFNHVRSSIEALDALNETRRGALLQLFGIIVGVILSAFALWSGAVQIQAPLCDAMKDGLTPCPKMEPNTAVDVVNWVVANPLGFVMILTVLGFFAFIAFFKGMTSVPYARRIITWVSRFASAFATSISYWLGGNDSIGQAVRLLIIGSLAGASGYVAYTIVPKHKVPTLGEEDTGRKGGWAQLDRLVGKKPAESGLFATSVIAQDLRDLSGSDYDDFLSLMASTSTLQREKVLWLTGTRANSPGRDAGYLIIDQANRKLEIGLRRDGQTKVYRSPGAVIVKPVEIAKTFDGVTADITPLAVQSPQCSAEAISGSRTLIFSGALPPAEHCEYKVPLRAGQILGYSQASAKGLQFQVGEPGRPPVPVTSFTAAKEGTHIVRILWQPGARDPARRSLRPFYLRAYIE